MAGVVWQAHGLAVVPTLRWRNKHDYDNVAAGIEQSSVVSVANYGSRTDAELTREFATGLAEVEYTSPIEASRSTRSPVAIPGQPTIFNFP